VALQAELPYELTQFLVQLLPGSVEPTPE
jgi:hypothetical protein